MRRPSFSGQFSGILAKSGSGSKTGPFAQCGGSASSSSSSPPSPGSPTQDASKDVTVVQPVDNGVEGTELASDMFPGRKPAQAPWKRGSSGNSSLERSFRIGPRGGGDPSSAQQTFRGNAVSTTKYELWNIVPKNLLEQFQRAANFWFLIVATCQMLPFQLSPTNEFATLLPLTFVLVLKLCKDAYEDQQRRRDDIRMNNQLCSVLDIDSALDTKLTDTRWRDVRVGNYVRLSRDEPIPADMILLSCLSEDGTAFVDTAQLDGETSLKPKYVLEPTMRISEAQELLEMEGHVDTEPPNQLVQSFNGMLFLQGHPRGYPIEANNFLLRGSTLRNTAWAFGLVVFTGHDTKLVQNLKPTPCKRSNVEVMANYLLLIVFGVLMTAALISAILRAIFMGAETELREQLSWVWPEVDPLQDNQYLAFVTFLIGYNNLIPISLYVTVDLVRTFQAVYMERDMDMYHKETDSPCRVRNSGLNENLGQVEFVLTDKTGTLTENHMQFKACSVGNMVYGCWDPEQGPVEHVVALPPPSVCVPLDSALARAQAKIERKRAQHAGETTSGTLAAREGSPAENPPAESPSSEADPAAKAASSAIGTVEGPEGAPSPPGRRGPDPAGSGGGVPSSEDSSEEELIDQFFICLATCHTAIIEEKKGLPKEAVDLLSEGQAIGVARSSSTASDMSEIAPLSVAAGCNALGGMTAENGSDALDLRKEATQRTFRSSSPDEEALVAAARDYGYFFRRKATARGVASQLTVNVRGRNQYYNVLICNEFSSDRKRMSVLVRRTEALAAGCSAGGTADCIQTKKGGGCSSPMMTLERLPLAHEIEQMDSTPSEEGSVQYPAVLYAKGADNVMLERLSKNVVAQQQAEGVKKQLQLFSSYGLRTLVVARRNLTNEQADYFVNKMRQAKGAFMNRDTMMESVANELEQDFRILGITAIEDRIQSGVPETINMCLRAGIKVWMLTGDNMETAINIGTACKLIDSSMYQYKFDASHGEVTPEAMLEKLGECCLNISQRLKQEEQPGEFKYCLIVHGKVLYTIMDEAQAKLRQLFLAIACSSCSVIACRLAPAQKAALVRLVKNNLVGSPLTLAIGDGGNDVSMIQEAHVGVGLLGVEGRQAANAADYTVGQFRFLRPLLFTHGRWNLRRTGIVIGYSFYKNFLLVLPLAFYAPYTGFSGTTLYESYLLMSFNVVFTSIPVLITGVFDIDVPARMALMVPILYQLGIQRRYFNSWMLVGWIARGAFHALLAFGTMQPLFRGSLADGASSGGHVPDYYVMGSWTYWAGVNVANATMLLHTKSWMDWQVVLTVVSALLYFPSLILYSEERFFLSQMFNEHMVGVAGVLFGHLRSWLGMLLVVAACALSDLAISAYRKMSAPDAGDILQEVHLGHFSGVRDASVDAWSDRAGHQACAEEYLKSLPMPLPRPPQVRPEGRFGLRPLRSPARERPRNGRTSPGATVRAVNLSVLPGHAAQVAPQGPEGHYVDVDTIGKSSEAGEIDRPSQMIITYPETCGERLRLAIWDCVQGILRKQWTEMTVAELTATLSFDRIEVSKNFKSALRAHSTSAQRDYQQVRDLRASASLASEGVEANQTTTSRERRSSTVQRDNDACDSPSPVSRSLSHECSERVRLDHAKSVASGSEFSRRTSINSVTSTVSELSCCSTSDSNEVISDLMYSIITLRFMSSSQELAFRNFLGEQAAQLFRKCLMAVVVALMLYNIYALAAGTGGRSTWVQVFVCTAAVPCGCLTGRFLHMGIFENYAELFIVAFVVTTIIAKHCYDILAQNVGLFSNTFLPYFVMAATRIRFVEMFMVLCFHMLMLITRYWLLAGTPLMQESQGDGGVELVGNQPPWEYLVLMLGVTTLTLYYTYQLEKIMRKDFFVLDSIKSSKHQSMEILKGMFPEEVVNHVLTQIRQGSQGGVEAKAATKMKAIREERGIVTVLFLDICDFDSLVEMLQPEELVQLLDLIWMMFDRLCERHGVQKIETVGKTYMAAAMPEDASSNSAQRHQHDALNVVITAVAMLELVARRNVGHTKIPKVAVRIGAHTGKVISGVVGSLKPQFALFGDTVNTASRMQSTGKANCLHISGDTYELLKNDKRFEWEKRITQVKGRDLMETYLLRRYNVQHLLQLRHGINRTSPSKEAVAAQTGETADGPPPLELLEGSMPPQTPIAPPSPVVPPPPKSAPKRLSVESRRIPSHSPGRVCCGNAGGVSSEPISSRRSASMSSTSLGCTAVLPTSMSSGPSLGGATCSQATTTNVGTDVSNPSMSMLAGSPSSSSKSSAVEKARLNVLSAGQEEPKTPDASFVSSDKDDNWVTQPMDGSQMMLNNERFDLSTGPKLVLVAPPVNGQSPMEQLNRLPSQVIESTWSRWCGKDPTNWSRWCRFCCVCYGRDVNSTQRIRGSPMMSQWVSFLAFWACYAAESLCVLFGGRSRYLDERGSRQRALALAMRLGYMGLALTAGALLGHAGRKLRWGVKTSNLVPALFSDIIAVIVFIGFFCSMASHFQSGSTEMLYWSTFEAFFFVMVLMHLCRLHSGAIPLLLCFSVIVSILGYVAARAKNEMDTHFLFECIFFSLFISGAHFFATLGDPRQALSDYKAICEEHERVSELLNSILPSDVLHEFKQGNLSLAYNFEDMTFLFADIVGFTRYCFEHTAEQAVNLVTRLFAEFDQQAKALGVYKVCTIGDAYVVVNEPSMDEKDKCLECVRVFNMAKLMLQTICRVRKEVQHDALDMRIGMHHGNFVGGVIGTKRLRFDIWGEDVLIGNKVESYGVAGKICVSDTAKQVLEAGDLGGQLLHTFHQDMKLKGDRGVLKTYITTGYSEEDPDKPMTPAD